MPAGSERKFPTQGKPNPGSYEAIHMGCTCPVYENHHGKGYIGGKKGITGVSLFVVDEYCPLHGFREPRFGYKPPRHA
ncbi:hypothetical protein [Desulfovibrio inopinatus]|uniref:hypothetical protein n=1 Tax=Desulfovibrio inopinatus TaxID=102109 RepID=UPI0004873D22|nr:hypothetical protein [Desulfovibrio inopinatus]